MFTLSKILGFLAQPSTVAALVLATGLVLIGRGRRVRLGLRLAWLSLAYFVIGGIFPLGNVIILPLEQRFADVAPPDPGQPIAGIIILGGFEDGWVSAGRGGLAINESAERLTEGLRLALRHPQAKVVFTGGVGGLWPSGQEATQAISQFLQDTGIDPRRIVLENKSRNTIENALFTKEILSPKSGEQYLLVTSAYHMPRSMGLFRKTGFNVRAYPVDFRTRGPEDVTRSFERISAGLQRMDLAVNEWFGLIAYRALGRIDELFPGP